MQVQQRVIQILKKYYNSPLLLGKKILQLTRGDEGFPKPILIEQKDDRFRLYAAMDCVFIESDDRHTLHILDFKTGKAAFDKRQALVYLLAANYLYPGKEAVASFYNLELCQESELISLKRNELEDLKIELINIAKKHYEDVQQYQDAAKDFSEIFPPNPGYHCRFCPFQSICEFSAQSHQAPSSPIIKTNSR